MNIFIGVFSGVLLVFLLSSVVFAPQQEPSPLSRSKNVDNFSIILKQTYYQAVGEISSAH